MFGKSASFNKSAVLFINCEVLQTSYNVGHQSIYMHLLYYIIKPTSQSLLDRRVFCFF